MEFHDIGTINHNYKACLQILTVTEPLESVEVDYPPIGANMTFRKGPKAEADEQEALSLPLPPKG
jgi:hypothetical protein